MKISQLLILIDFKKKMEKLIEEENKLNSDFKRDIQIIKDKKETLINEMNNFIQIIKFENKETKIYFENLDFEKKTKIKEDIIFMKMNKIKRLSKPKGNSFFHLSKILIDEIINE
jgi:hypothetical protein